MAVFLAGAVSDVTSHAAIIRPASLPSPVRVGVDPAQPGREVKPGFVGLSFEYWALENYAGKNPAAVDPVLVRLLRAVAPGPQAVLRIGGVTTDRTWWRAPAVTPSPAAFYNLTPRRLRTARALATATGARLVLGVQFEANNAGEVASESRAMLRIVGRRRLAALELGNEPELYAHRWFYFQGANQVFGRPLTWDFPSFVRNYQQLAAVMPPVPLAGPAIGGYSWMTNLPQFLSAQHVSLVTLHRYPMQACSTMPQSPNYPSISHMLGLEASQGLAADFEPYVTMVHSYGLPVRNAEMNSVSCGDAHGVADTFASALWAVDALFGMADIGVDGVNIHTYPGAADELFSVRRRDSRWRAMVAPEYYGLLMFAQAAPPGARLLRTSSDPATDTLRTWATRAHTGTIHVVLINDALDAGQTVALHVHGCQETGWLERLQAPGASSTGGVRLGGRTFGASTTTGVLGGPSHLEEVEPHNGAYVISLPPTSAAMLTLR